MTSRLARNSKWDRSVLCRLAARKPGIRQDRLLRFFCGSHLATETDTVADAELARCPRCGAWISSEDAAGLSRGASA